MSDYERYVEMWVHEVKTPLAAVHLTVENLMADPAEAQTDPARLDSIDAGLRRIEGYVDQALYVARSETLEADYLIRAHRVGDVVTAALKANARELIAAHMAPRLGGGMDLTVLADDKWLGFAPASSCRTPFATCAKAPREGHRCHSRRASRARGSRASASCLWCATTAAA